MSLIFARQDFDPSCPSGGTWYACGSDNASNFVGCCNKPACDNGCTDGSLEPASFDPAYFEKFPDQECPTGSRWYTCAATTPPFMGCCKSNPCAAGCPVGDLTAGFLSSNPKIAAAFSPSGGVSPIASSPATSTSSAIATSSSETTSAASAADKTAVTGGSSHAGVIAGGVVGGVAAIALLIVLLLFFCKRSSANAGKYTRKSQVLPELPTPMYEYMDSDSGEAFAQDQKKGHQHETQFSTPAPQYPTSPSLPAYQSPPAEMDSQSQPRPQQSPSQSFHQAFPTSGNFAPNGLGLNTNSHDGSASYTAYSSANPQPVLSPLASPMIELDGTASTTSPSSNTMAARR